MNEKVGLPLSKVESSSSCSSTGILRRRVAIGDISLNARALDTTPQDRMLFEEDGFVSFKDVPSPLLVNDLNERLEEILRGRYDRGQAPDKAPKLIASKGDNSNSRQVAPLGFSGNLQNVKVMQVINVHKADQLFRNLACNPALGAAVAKLSNWKSTRLAQDQVWAMPLGARPHELESLIVSMAGLPAGSLSIHNGMTWHGSGKNKSKDRPRRGLNWYSLYTWACAIHTGCNEESPVETIC